MDLTKNDLDRLYILAERGFIASRDSTDNDLIMFERFKESIDSFMENYKLRKIVNSEYMSYDELLSSIPKQGFTSLDNHSEGVKREPWELEIIYKLQVLRKLLMEIKK